MLDSRKLALLWVLASSRNYVACQYCDILYFVEESCLEEKKGRSRLTR